MRALRVVSVLGVEIKFETMSGEAGEDGNSNDIEVCTDRQWEFS